MNEVRAGSRIETVPLEGPARRRASLLWIGTLFFGCIPSLIVLIVKPRDTFVLITSKYTLNWALFFLVLSFFCWILMPLLIGFPLKMLLFCAHVVFCLKGAWRALKGQVYATPFTFKLFH